ncbi:MAG: hypothetical protein ABI818_12290 [Acidobacteriota bacterium]
MRFLLVGAASLLLVTPSAYAQTEGNAPVLFSTPPVQNAWHINWASSIDNAKATVPAQSLAIRPTLFEQDSTQPLHAAAIEHSEAYQKRRKIHKYASFATLPLFATELILGQSLYSADGNADGRKGAHVAVGAGIGTLFAANTVTGIWNMFGKEGRSEKQGRKLRLVHGLLMMAADVGFMATTLAAPDGEDGRASSSGRSRHRNLAVASISVGTAGYLVMIFGNR